MIQDASEIAAQKDYGRKVEAFAASLVDQPQPDCSWRHFFAPNVYLREMTMPTGSTIVGHIHKTEHLNIILKGKAKVMMQDDEVLYIEAPDIFISKPGVQKVLHIIEEMTWATVHPTKETEMDKLEEELIVKSDVIPNLLGNECNRKKLKEDNSNVS